MCIGMFNVSGHLMAVFHHAILTGGSSDEGYFPYFYGSNAYYAIDINNFVKNEP